jgi:hypothetical protein
MLAAKGSRVAMRLVTKGIVRPRGTMLHDESGSDWPSTSVLFMPFSRSGGDVDAAADDATAEKYFGYVPRAGSVTLPVENIDKWSFVNEVRAIDYTRPGGLPAQSNSFFDLINIWKRPAVNYRGDYEHEFKSGWFIFKTGAPALYRLNSIYRLEFPPWSTINWRGFVTP